MYGVWHSAAGFAHRGISALLRSSLCRFAAHDYGRPRDPRLSRLGTQFHVQPGTYSRRPEMETPLFDLNYGLSSDRDQLKVEFAVVQNDPEGEDAEWGISDLLVGYKYRFLDADENHGWAVSFYPQVSSPTGDTRAASLGSGQTELFFPFEFQKSFCDDKVWVNPEIGYNIVIGGEAGSKQLEIGSRRGTRI